VLAFATCRKSHGALHQFKDALQYFGAEEQCDKTGINVGLHV
jgi:hypothetical protein